MEMQQQLAHKSLQRSFSLSRLLALVLEYWAFVLQQDTCVLTQPLGSLGDSVMSKAGFSSYNWEEDEGYEQDGFEHMEDVNHNSTVIATAEHDVIATTDTPQAKWDMTRFLLNEERDRLCLWNSSITNELLDWPTPELDERPSMPNKLLRVAIQDSLARIGRALLNATSGTCGKENNPECKIRKELEMMVDIALEDVHEAFSVDNLLDGKSDIVSLIADGSECGSIIGESESDLFSILKTSIETLESLSFLQ
ncbi:hypothetical protein F4801DRAFT_286 [Xylaria longipes]|nr:hypothetical protein F4801DRAFT_286 [Xylaria longipes]RYC58656.1 hypothetical protein CHU98_g7555 [Xylaria longipes]